MGRMQQTMDRAQNSVRSAIDTSSSESRAAAAGFVERLGAGIRRQSHRAARATEETGDRIGSQLERKATEIRPRRSPAGRMGGYATRHPLQGLFLIGLLAAIVALIAVPAISRRGDG